MSWLSRTLRAGVLGLAACRAGPESTPPDPPDPEPLLHDVTECVPSEPPGNEGYDTLPVDGMEVTRWCLGPEHVSGYRDNEGGDPAFNVVRPKTFQHPEAPHPVLVYLHGGVIGVDENPTGNRFCFYQREEGVDEEGDPIYAGSWALIDNAVYNNRTILELVRRNDWIFVVPESNWCDLWSGMGPSDPVDPAHGSLRHVETVLDVLSAGLDGLRVDEEHIYAWGTSIGAEGAWVLAGGYAEDPHPIAGIVPDSGPFATVDWYSRYDEEHADYSQELSHIVGGDPFEADGVTPSAVYPNYARFDVGLLVREKGVRVPAFLAWNSEDRIVEPDHGPYAAATLEAVYGAEGVRHVALDFDHHAPDGVGHNYHTQTPNEGIPWAYTTTAAFDFLSGDVVRYHDAETWCAPTACALVHESDPAYCTDPDDPDSCWADNPAAAMVRGTAVRRRAEEGPGLLFSGDLPPTVPRGVPLTLRLVLAVDGLEGLDPTTPLVDLSVSTAGRVLTRRAWTRAEFADAGSPPATQLVDQVRDTSIDGDLDGDGVAEGLPDGPVTVTLTVSGAADVYFDGVWAAAD